MLTKLRRLGVVALAAMALMTLVSVSPAQAQEGDNGEGDVSIADVAHPCIRRTYHDHGTHKDVHLRNDCGARRYVKVIVAYGPDSGCIAMDSLSNWRFWWAVGWPYAASRLDRVEWC